MVVSMAAIFSAFSELQGISQNQELIDLELLKMGAFTAAEMTPHLFASGVKMPVLMIQVLKDSWTRNPEDAQKTFDLLASKDKELFWIEGTTRRFKDGYNYFGRHPGTASGAPFGQPGAPGGAEPPVAPEPRRRPGLRCGTALAAAAGEPAASSATIAGEGIVPLRPASSLASRRGNNARLHLG
jgi:hypothetical protein